MFVRDANWDAKAVVDELDSLLLMNLVRTDFGVEVTCRTWPEAPAEVVVVVGGDVSISYR